jgi:phosphohistidine swiveling domain-containing protein
MPMGREAMPFVVGLKEDRALDPAQVGRKFAALARASRFGFAVPTAVAVRTAAHRYFLIHGQWPDGLREAVAEAAAAIGLSEGISIRSSATREDLGDQSFAGQYRTFLHVFGKVDLERKIQDCWLSADNASVRSYLKAKGTATENNGAPLMGVILQRMIQAHAAGVAFSRHPLNPSRDELVLEGVRGTADHLVDGRLSPHRVFVGKSGPVRHEPPSGEADRHAEPPAPLLSNQQWQQIAMLLTSLEAAVAEGPLDIEWAVDYDGRTWLLQYRPITTVTPHDTAVPAGSWTRRVADDLWADRLTPFLGHAMLKNAPRFNLSRISAIVGVPVVSPTLAVIDGYLYVNCAGIRRAVSHLPVKFRTADVRGLFPPGDAFDMIPPPGVFRLAGTLLRSLLLIVLEPQVNPLICLGGVKRHWQRIQRRLDELRRQPDTTAREAFAKTRRALAILADIQERNQWPYFHATLFTWLLRWLVVDYAGRPHACFLDLIGRGGDNVSIDIERRFRQLAETITNDEGLRTAFLTQSAEALCARLPEGIKDALEDFLARYGCRSRHRTLYFKRWGEAPEEVVAILQSLVRRRHAVVAAATPPVNPASNGPQGPPEGDETTAASERNGRCSGRHRFPLLLWLLQPVLLPLARRFLDLREQLRFLLDMTLCEMRKCLLALGQRIDLGEKVLFLTEEDLEQRLEGRLSPQEAARMAADRHEAFRRTVTVSTFYVDGRPVEDFSAPAGVLKGVGTSPGRVTGTARLVSDPSRANVQKGDILIAENTDPGWTPILSLAGGIVVEEGGLLNHCSIVARELRVPAIVGVRQATRVIAEGQLITIDGGLGLIRFEEG